MRKCGQWWRGVLLWRGVPHLSCPYVPFSVTAGLLKRDNAKRAAGCPCSVQCSHILTVSCPRHRHRVGTGHNIIYDLICR